MIQSYEIPTEYVKSLPESGEAGIVYVIDNGEPVAEAYQYKNGGWLPVNLDATLSWFLFEEYQEEVAEKLSEPFKMIGATEDGISVPPGETITRAIPLNPPEGYRFGAYRELAIMDATTDGKNSANVILRWFGSAGQGTMANVSFKNIGEEEAIVRVAASVLFYKG